MQARSRIQNSACEPRRLLYGPSSTKPVGRSTERRFCSRPQLTQGTAKKLFMSAPQMRAATVDTGTVDQPSGAWPFSKEAMFAATVSIAVETAAWSAPVRSEVFNPRSASTTPPPSAANAPLLNNSSAVPQNEATKAPCREVDPQAMPDAAHSTAAINALDTPPCTRAECPARRDGASVVAGGLVEDEVVCLRSSEVETIEIHDLRPRRNEVVHELLLGVVAGIHLGKGPKLGG